MTPIHNTGVARTPANIQDGDLCSNSKQLNALTIASKLFASDICRGSDYTSTEADK